MKIVEKKVYERNKRNITMKTKISRTETQWKIRKGARRMDKNRNK